MHLVYNSLGMAVAAEERLSRACRVSVFYMTIGVASTHCVHAVGVQFAGPGGGCRGAAEPCLPRLRFLQASPRLQAPQVPAYVRVP